MTETTNAYHDIDVPGLDGSNPLGYLAALGLLVELSATESAPIRMSWKICNGNWKPTLRVGPRVSPAEVSQLLAAQLRLNKCSSESGAALEAAVSTADKAHMSAKKRLKDALDDIKKRKLRGKERQQAIETETRPLVAEVNQKRTAWLQLLKESSPSPELALGKDPAAMQEHFRLTAQEIASDVLPKTRGSADLIAAFGCDAVVDPKSSKVRATSFCFVTGSGHQYFLENVRELLNCVDVERIQQALFSPQPHSDPKLSMRWDPIEDRRYAMMWSDPTSSGNEAKTNWALNLLAYRGLQLMPCVPKARRAATTGFSSHNQSLDWTWPLWSAWLTQNSVRTLLSLQELQDDEPPRAVLAPRGIVEVFRASRIQVGNPPLHKLNFTPPRSV